MPVPRRFPATAPLIADASVRDVFVRLADRFGDEELIDPRHVVEVEQAVGEARAIRKLAVFTRMDEFLRCLGIRR